MMIKDARPILSKKDIVFEFEEFLETHEENLPEGLDVQYMAYIPILEDPIRNLRRLPKALRALPVSALLHQKWKSIYTLMGILFIMALPSFGLLINTARLLGKASVGFALVLFIIFGVFASIIYLKKIYASLNSLVDSRKAPWLVEKIKKPFSETYQKKWNKKLLSVSFILPIIMEVPLAYISLSALDFKVDVLSILIWLVLILVGHVGISIMVFISLLSFYYVILNTKIYDQLLQTIIDRVTGYTEGHESILSKKNYEVVGVLSDTPGLSIRSLGDIPVFGLGAGIFIINALMFLLFSPFMLAGPLADFLSSISGGGGDNVDKFGINYIILVGILISSLVSFGAVLRPLMKITGVMVTFKTKALSELDPFIFDEITGVALRKDTEITNETQVLYMLRNYIYTMKVSPVHPFKLIQMVLLALLYGARLLPLIIKLFGG